MCSAGGNRSDRRLLIAERNPDVGVGLRLAFHETKPFSTAELLARGREDGSGPPCLHGDAGPAAGS